MIWSLLTVYLWFGLLWLLIYDLIPYDNFVIWHTTVLVLWWFIYYLIPYDCLFMIWSLITVYLWFDPSWLFNYDLIPLLYSLTLPLMMMMKVKRGRMEGWFPLGTASTCLKTWWRTCTLTRRRASCGCGGFIRNVKEASWGTTWGRWTKSIWIKCVKKLGWCYLLFKEKEHYLLNLAVQCSDGWLFITSEKFKTTSTICMSTWIRDRYFLKKNVLWEFMKMNSCIYRWTAFVF